MPRRPCCRYNTAVSPEHTGGLRGILLSPRSTREKPTSPPRNSACVLPSQDSCTSLNKKGIVESECKALDCYQQGQSIGGGNFGEAFLASPKYDTNNELDKEVVGKEAFSDPAKGVFPDLVDSECVNLVALSGTPENPPDASNDHLMKFYGCFRYTKGTREGRFIVMENTARGGGGELHDYFDKHGADLKLAKRLLKGVLESLVQIHLRGKKFPRSFRELRMRSTFFRVHPSGWAGCIGFFLGFWEVYCGVFGQWNRWSRREDLLKTKQIW